MPVGNQLFLFPLPFFPLSLVDIGLRCVLSRVVEEVDSVERVVRVDHRNNGGLGKYTPSPGRDVDVGLADRRIHRGFVNSRLAELDIDRHRDFLASQRDQRRVSGDRFGQVGYRVEPIPFRAS